MEPIDRNLNQAEGGQGEVIMAGVEGTGVGLREFVMTSPAMAELTPAAQKSIRAAVRSVLKTLGDPAEVDIEHLDVDLTLSKWEHRYGRGYAAATRETYKARFRMAVGMYRAALSGESYERGSRRRKPLVDLPIAIPETRTPEDRYGAGAVAAPVATHLVKYSLPLRPGLLVELVLPADLTQKDADRIAGFVRSLAFDSPLSVAESDVEGEGG